MRLIWGARRAVSDDIALLRSKGFDPVLLGLDSDRGCRITRPFPVFLDQRGKFVEEAFSFLFDVGFIRGSTTSIRTLETYAESLLSWLSYAERQQLQWKRPTAAMLASFRDYLLGTARADSEGGHRSPLSRRTVNLRLTVAIEFYKHLGRVRTDDVPSRGPTTAQRASRLPDLQRLRVRIYKRRPRALSAEHCRSLCDVLRLPYRLMWQWALCTGLRTHSLVRIELKAFNGLLARAHSDQTISVGAKGGKTVVVHVPPALRDATERYIEVDRMLAAASSRTPSTDALLFLNRRGRPVTRQGYYQAVRRAAARLRITVRPHQARATFATCVRQRLKQLDGVGGELDAVKIVQALLAHADASTTEEYLESIDVPSIDVLQVLDDLALPTAQCEASR